MCSDAIRHTRHPGNMGQVVFLCRVQMAKAKAKVEGVLGTRGDTWKVSGVRNTLWEVAFGFGWGLDDIWCSLKNVS